MTLRELQTQLEAIDEQLQKLRRGDYEIQGDAVFATSMRQYIVESLQGVRNHIDNLILGLDRVDDVEKLKSMRSRIAAGFQNLLKGAE